MFFGGKRGGVPAALGQEGLCGQGVDSVDGGQVDAVEADQFRLQIEVDLVLSRFSRLFPCRFLGFGSGHFGL